MNFKDMGGNWAKMSMKLKTNFYLPVYFSSFDTTNDCNVLVDVKW